MAYNIHRLGTVQYATAGNAQKLHNPGISSVALRSLVDSIYSGFRLVQSPASIVTTPATVKVLEIAYTWRYPYYVYRSSVQITGLALHTLLAAQSISAPGDRHRDIAPFHLCF